MGANICWLAGLAVGLVIPLTAQRANTTAPAPAAQAPASNPAALGIALTRSGHFADAIPHLQQAAAQPAALAAPAQAFALRYDLALCYFGTMQYPLAIATLETLRRTGQHGAEVDNLLTQAYIAAGQRDQARAAFTRAQQQSPLNEKLYAYVADACNDHAAYDLGLAFMDAGLTALPDSARLHYERGLFLAQLDRLPEALPEFERAQTLAPALGSQSDIGLLAAVQRELYLNHLVEALSLIRQAIAAGHRDYRILSLLGTVLIETGVAPGDPGFAEAENALEASVAAQPHYPSSQLALGRLYLMQGRAADAADHLQAARLLDPRNPAVYAGLASAYGRLGNPLARQQSLATLARLVNEKSSANAQR